MTSDSVICPSVGRRGDSAGADMVPLVGNGCMVARTTDTSAVPSIFSVRWSMSDCRLDKEALRAFAPCANATPLSSVNLADGFVLSPCYSNRLPYGSESDR